MNALDWAFVWMGAFFGSLFGTGLGLVVGARLMVPVIKSAFGED